MADFGEKEVRPPEAKYEQDVLAWAVEAMQEGEAFQKAQPGYEKIDDTIRAVMSATRTGDILPGPLSKLDDNRLAKTAIDLASGLTDTKLFWEYQTYNKRYEQAGVVATKLARAWWTNSQADRIFAHAIWWCLVAGSCAMRLVYNRERGDLELQAWDPRDVLPIRPNGMLDYQDGHGVLIRQERTVNDLIARYPEKKDRIKPDRDGAYVRISSGGLLDRIASVASPLLKGVFDQRSRQQVKVPSCDMWTIEVKDDSLNETGQTVLMGPHDKSGKPRYNYCYAAEPGEPLYPRGRVIVTTKSCSLYDGPMIYWHGNFDVMKMSLDELPFSWFGKAPLHDLLPLQEALKNSFRLCENTIKKLQRPGVVGDKQNVPKAQWAKIDTSLAGMKVLQNSSMGKGFQLIETNPQIISTVLPYIAALIQEMEFISGVKDVTNFAKLGQMPASETIEKMMEAMSPAIRSRSRTLEAFLRPLAYQVLSGFMQFYPMQKRCRILGPQGTVLEDFDFDKGTLVPDFIHPEDLDSSGFPTMTARSRGPRPAVDRAQFFLPQFNFYIPPGSLLRSSEVTDKMMYLQLARAGYIDIETLLDKLGIPNSKEIMAKVAAQAQMGIGMNVSAAGRKASGQQPPQMRPDGRISESG